MRTFTLYLTKADIKRCRAFTKARAGDNDLYKKRGGFKEVDVLSGAMAEVAVYKLLSSRDVAVSHPDFSIHNKGKKSYNADLTDGYHNFHVKGQTLESKQKYGASWIMQRKDPIINSPENLHYLVPCTVDVKTGRVEIYGIFSIPSLVKNGCVEECKVEWFRKTKVALYLHTLEESFTEKTRWGFFKSYNRKVRDGII